MLRVDLHMHTDYSPDSETSPERLVARCLKMGLNCIAVTDHNTIEGALEVQRIAPFLVIVGEEITSSEGEITGLFLKEAVARGLPAVETARRIKVSQMHVSRLERGALSKLRLIIHSRPASSQAADQEERSASSRIPAVS